MRQPSLLDAPAKADMAFIAYHTANPEVYAAFRDLALRLLRRGVTHYGAKAVMEVVRYQTAIRAEGEPLKINNNHTSRYARLLMANDVRFIGFFELRELRPSAKGRAA